MDFLAGAWSPPAIAYFLAAAVVAAAGGAVLFYERFTAASRRFMVLTTVTAGWLTTLGFAVASTTAAATAEWLRLTWIIDPFTAPAFFWMTLALTSGSRRRLAWVLFGIGGAFSLIGLAGPWLVEGLQSATRGRTLSGFGWLGLGYFLFIGSVVGLAIRDIAMSARRVVTSTESMEKTALLLGFGVGALTLVDYWVPAATYRAGWITPLSLAAAALLGVLAAVRFRVFAAQRAFGTDEVLRTMSDAVLILDAAGRIQSANAAARDLLGQKEATLLGSPVSEHLFERSGASAWSPMPGERIRDHELRAVASDGSATAVSVAVEPLKGASRDLGTVVVARDIHERLEVARALEAAELRYNSLFWHNPGLAYEVSTNGRIVNANDATAELFGVPREDVVGRPFAELLAPESRATADDLFRKAAAGRPEQYEITLRTDGGRSVFLKGVSIPIIEDGELVAIAGMAFDITGERRARRELEVQRRYFEALFDNLPEALILVGEDNQIERVNRQFTRLFGYTQEEAVGEDVEALIVPEHLWDRGREMARAVTAGEAVQTETVRRTKTGGTVEVSVLGHELDIPGMPRQIYAIYRDISERKEAERQLQEREEELRHAQRLESVGKLAGGVAHDFNNLLTVINGHAQFALEERDLDAGVRIELEEIEKAGVRAATLTQQLLAFSRRQVLHPRTLDLSMVIRELLGMLQRLIGEHIQVETDFHEDPLHVEADRGQLEQVLVNLAVNARDAMPDGGTLTLATEPVHLQPDDPRVDLWEVEPGPFVCLRVSDTGHGMDPDTMARIFEPFFTTKEQGSGTGLGLSTVFGIMKQSGGHVEARSEPGGGSEFDVLLPRVDAVPTEQPEAASSDRATCTGATVLVVEDEAPVRQLAARILEREGCTVISAANGVQALERVKEHGDELDLVVTDLIMPEMGGHELADRLSRLQPELPILFMSGYDDELGGGGGDESDFLAKPFTPRSFVQWVARRLQRH